jgi:hypothetical protein
MEISHALKTAHETIVEAGLPAELQEVAFAEVLRHMLSGAPQPTGQSPARPGSMHPGSKPSGVARLAARVGVSEAALADVFEIVGDNVSLHVSSSRISSSKSGATKEVALLIAAARQGSGIDDAWTSVGYVRDALQQYNRYDLGNFSAYLHRAADAFNFRGKGTALEVRLTKPGWEIAITLLRSVAGENS